MDRAEGLSPYKGLIPYSEGDWPYFFGREGEIELISANLIAWRHTLLYGASGVGKTSLLEAGVAHQLRLQYAASTEEHKWIVVLFRAWQDNPIASLLAAVRDATNQAGVDSSNLPESGSRPLAEVLAEWARMLDCTYLLILDQFEEYFTYADKQDRERTLIEQLARVIALPDVAVNVLISIREDQLSKLDTLKQRVPTLYQHSIRIEHLREEDARRAITGPLERYNEHTGAHVTPGPGLVDAVLEQLRGRDIQAFLGEDSKRGTASASNDARTAPTIQAPLLQLVMTRLWDEEVSLKSSTLRSDTLTRRLGGAEKVLSTHLERTLDRLTSKERQVALATFDYLVTEAGLKQAQAPADLARYTKFSEKAVQAALIRLSGPDFRILRPVEPPPGSPGLVRYEIFHDALAPAIRRYADDREKARISNRSRLRLASAFVALAVILGIAEALDQYRQAVWPWAFGVNLATGEATEFHGPSVFIGREAKGTLTPTISLPSTLISRLHVLISRDQSRALDMRSLNGTTVNARFLRYGEEAQLRDGDLLVLAGIAPIQYRKTDYPWYQLQRPDRGDFKITIQPGAWGLLVDGHSRRFEYLFALQYFLWIDDKKGVVISQQPTSKAWMKFQVDPQVGLKVEDMPDDNLLEVLVKSGDYTYWSCPVRSGINFATILPDARYCTRSGPPRDKPRPEQLFKVSFRYGKTAFQIVSTYLLQER